MLPRLVPKRPVADSSAPASLTLEAIYRAHFDYVYRLAARLGWPRVEPEEAAQEVFLVAGRRLHTFDGTSQVTTWLYGITLNVVRGLRRRARLRHFFEGKTLEEARGAFVLPIDRAEVRQAHRIAYEILDKLSPKKREAFILAEFEGLSCEEIGQLVGAKTETVWSRLHYARREFETRLAARSR